MARNIKFDDTSLFKEFQEYKEKERKEEFEQFIKMKFHGNINSHEQSWISNSNDHIEYFIHKKDNILHDSIKHPRSARQNKETTKDLKKPKVENAESYNELQSYLDKIKSLTQDCKELKDRNTKLYQENFELRNKLDAQCSESQNSYDFDFLFEILYEIHYSKDFKNHVVSMVEKIAKKEQNLKTFIEMLEENNAKDEKVEEKGSSFNEAYQKIIDDNKQTISSLKNELMLYIESMFNNEKSN